MAYKCYYKVSESEFHNIVFKRDKLQDLIINKKKTRIQDSCEKDEKPTTKPEPSDNTNVVKQTHLDEKFSKYKVRFLILKNITTNLNHNTTNDLWKKY